MQGTLDGLHVLRMCAMAAEVEHECIRGLFGGKASQANNCHFLDQEVLEGGGGCSPLAPLPCVVPLPLFHDLCI